MTSYIVYTIPDWSIWKNLEVLAIQIQTLFILVTKPVIQPILMMLVRTDVCVIFIWSLLAQYMEISSY